MVCISCVGEHWKTLTYLKVYDFLVYLDCGGLEWDSCGEDGCDYNGMMMIIADME